ncbi:hypothetical protein HSRCO_2711 [Halanaeroarchaeum sp. HSR-CO]|nr:hypothetical protein HSRCO_2711 [Halanaeroarchaeum sp. HSR-CO]
MTMKGAGTIETAVARAGDRPILPDGSVGRNILPIVPRVARCRVTDHQIIRP